MFETKSLHSRNSYVGHLKVIHELPQIKELRYKKLDVWAGPKFFVWRENDMEWLSFRPKTKKIAWSSVMHNTETTLL